MKKLFFILLTLLCCKVYAQPDNQDHAYTGHSRYLVPGTISINRGSDAIGDIYYRNPDGTLNRLGIGTAGQVLTVSAGLPAWLTGGGGGAGTVTSVSSGNLFPLFTVGITNPTTTPTFNFVATSVLAHRWYGNPTGGITTPSFSLIDTGDVFQFWRARGLLSATAPITYNVATGVFSTSMNTARLIGRTTSGTGVMHEIKIGTGLTFSNDTLKATGGSGSNPTKSQAVDTLNAAFPTSIDLNNNLSVTVGSNSSAITPTTVSTVSSTAGTYQNSDGSITQVDFFSGHTVISESQYWNDTIAIDSAQVKSLGGTPFLAIPRTNGYFTEILAATIQWWGGTATAYDGLGSIYFYTNGTNTPQFKIACAGVSVAPYIQRGSPYEIPLGEKDNIYSGGDVYVNTESNSSSTGANAVIYIRYRKTKTIH